MHAFCKLDSQVPYKIKASRRQRYETHVKEAFYEAYCGNILNLMTESGKKTSLEVMHRAVLRAVRSVRSCRTYGTPVRQRMASVWHKDVRRHKMMCFMPYRSVLYIM